MNKMNHSTGKNINLISAEAKQNNRDRLNEVKCKDDYQIDPFLQRINKCPYEKFDLLRIFLRPNLVTQKKNRFEHYFLPNNSNYLAEDKHHNTKLLP